MTTQSSPVLATAFLQVVHGLFEARDDGHYYWFITDAYCKLRLVVIYENNFRFNLSIEYIICLRLTVITMLVFLHISYYLD
jgi:hypothetical protein